MSYLEQQKLVEAETVEHERRKIEDELEIKNEETHTILHVDNEQNDRAFVKHLRIYCCEWSCESVIFKKFQVRLGQGCHLMKSKKRKTIFLRDSTISKSFNHFFFYL
jgi:hypothetical protein